MMIMDMIKMARMDRQLVQLLFDCFCFFCGAMPILYSDMFYLLLLSASFNANRKPL